jgi:Ni,Fe-hydrogenase I cytochrome b subunit
MNELLKIIIFISKDSHLVFEYSPVVTVIALLLVLLSVFTLFMTGTTYLRLKLNIRRLKNVLSN